MSRICSPSVPWALALVLTAGCDDAPKKAEADAAASPEPAQVGSDAPKAEDAKVADAKADVASDTPPAGGVGNVVKGQVDLLGEGGQGGSTGAGVEPPLELDEDPGPVGDELAALPTGTMAVVGKTKIPMADFRAIYDLKIKKYADRGRTVPKSADRRYRKSIAERLIYHQLLADEVARIGVTVDPTELAEHRARVRKGIKDWAKHLSRRGETEASLDALVMAELHEKTILQSEGALDVSAADIKADYAKIKDNWDSPKMRAKASHILVPIVPRGAPEPSASERKRLETKAKKRADELYAKVTAPGADFGAIAISHSTGPSASKGGDIGIFTPDRMTEAFSDTAFKMKPGEISKPVQTKFGWHIIKLTGKWGPGPLPQSALADQIRDRLQQRQLHQGRRELKERLLKAATIVDHVEPTLGPEPKRGPRSGPPPAEPPDTKSP